MKIGPRSLRPRARGESATFFLFHLHSLLLTVDFVCVCVCCQSLWFSFVPNPRQPSV